MPEIQQPDDAKTTDATAAKPGQGLSSAPKPAMPTPATMKPARATGAKPSDASPSTPVPSAALDATRLSQSIKFGRADADGHVVVIVDGEDVPVGQYPGATPNDALEYFARKFVDILSQMDLLAQRIRSASPAAELRRTIATVREHLEARNTVGDINSALARLSEFEADVTALEAKAQAEVEQERSAALNEREALVAEAEVIAAQDPAKTQWKTSSTRMNELFDAWKLAQREGPRLGKHGEDELWKRFRAARTTFDRHRKAHFSQMDSANAEAKSAKERLIETAEKLSGSTDWGATAAEFRNLMDQWKRAPRGSRKQDDELWLRFRAAQDVFFDARKAANDELETQFEANVAVKDELLVEAKALLPVKDVSRARRALGSIQERWEAAGKVPRSAMQRTEAELRSVEKAVKDAEDALWKKTDPEAKARTNSVLTQLEDAIADLEKDLSKARAQGNAKAIEKASEALAARQAWLEQVRISASELD